MRTDGKRSRSKTSAGNAGGEGPTLTRRLTLLVLLAGWAFVMASLLGYAPSDPPSDVVWPANETVQNWCGPAGAHIAYILFRLLGVGAWVLVTLLGLGILSEAVGQKVRHPLLRVIGLVMLAVSVAATQHLLFPSSGSFPDLAGGLTGTVVTNELSARFGGLGAGIFVIVLGLIGAIVSMDEWLGWALSWTWAFTREKGVPAATAAGEAAMAVGATTARASGGLMSQLWAGWKASRKAKKKRKVRIDDLEGEVVAPKTAVAGGRKRRKKVAEEVDEEATDEDLGIDDPDEEAAEYEEEEAAPEVEIKPRRKRGKAEVAPVAAVEEAEEEEDEDDLPGAPQVFDQEALKAKIARLPVVFGQKDKAVATDADLAGLQSIEGDVDEKGYRFPGLDLLENPEENFTQTLEEHVREQAEALESALKQYRIDGEVVGIESGPVITMYDVRLSPGTKVAAISAVSSDIARALKAVNIRIVSNQVGKDTIGIEVPNATKEKVRLKELMSRTDRFSKMKLPMFLGKDASGEPLIEDLAKMPHMLIAGTTGSGKSVCINTIIMGFLYTKKPSELKLVLVDPKMVEMSQFKDIPHLMCPVVTEMAKAAAILEWAVAKMDERYELLAEAGCRDIAAYNELPWDELKERLGAKTPEEEARIPRKLPYMVFMIDELADLMMTAKEVEGSIIRIAQKARAVGIHLILATQRPQANVVTGLIKSNMPARLTFKVASGMDSRIVLDQKGGELLLGQGDMLFLTPSSHKLTRSQGTLVDDREIRRVVKFMKEVASPSFERQLIQLRAGDSDEQRIADSANNSSASLQAAQEDPMFSRAVEIVLETRRGSVSLLQRRLAIGYTRASRLIDLMGIAGIISDHKGSVARDVLITLDEWEAMKQIASEQGFDLTTGKSTQAELFPEGEDAAEEAPFETDEDAQDGDAEEVDEVDEDADEEEDEEDAEEEDELVDEVDEDAEDEADEDDSEEETDEYEDGEEDVDEEEEEEEDEEVDDAELVDEEDEEAEEEEEEEPAPAPARRPRRA